MKISLFKYLISVRLTSFQYHFSFTERLLSDIVFSCQLNVINMMKSSLLIYEELIIRRIYLVEL